ncbi:hypothetical protein SAMN04488498_104347 [Mesorhizobium albiziae]|uniref:Uncharacterized protein n=1 Tax=Neomesorhizobium albiziae TaxID=335020 RepID=A0A1I3YCR5_9HYPH|nr:hypothetical protein [Mesorhizobium albiziae]GLS29948.1 hypothetical protein GCM10007937_16560 [Mesorhizobium albiziae]SFK29595.1 hypothetical protein SAMN04488498_104347 [Mesorhizobium albiziae]
MAWTQSDLDRIEAAIASGTRRVRFQTHEVEYQSTGDMLKARDVIKAEIDASARPGVSFAEYEGGY